MRYSIQHPDNYSPSFSFSSATPSISSTLTSRSTPSIHQPPSHSTYRFHTRTPTPILASSTSTSTYSQPSRSLVDLARRLASHGPHKTETTSRRIRILFNGAIIADTLSIPSIPALYVWEHPHFPQFYLPMEAFQKPSGFSVHLTPGDSITSSPNSTEIIGGGLQLSVKRLESPDSDYKTLTEMVLFASDLSGPGSMLANMVKVRFDAVGQWFEEDTPIYIHPKDPYKRVDLLSSNRPIRVLVSDVVLATSQTCVHLYETSLPARYYIPLTAVDTALLRPSTTRSQCPYKGEAGYHSVAVKGEILRDIVWFYTRPTVECAGIAGLCCFYNELVDIEFQINGEWTRVERPKTHMI